MDLYAPGNKTITHRRGYHDNYYRTFRGYPEIGDNVIDMIHDWLRSDNVTHIMLFFKEKCGFSDDYAGFLTREVVRGNMTKGGKKK